MSAKKRRVAIIVIAAAALILTILYFVWIGPMTRIEDDGNVELELIDGEVKISDKLTNFYIYEQVKRSEIQRIRVENEFGGYEIFRNTADAFEISGIGILPFNAELFSSFVVTVGSPVALSRIAKDLGDDDWKIYGLDKPKASWILTTSQGQERKINVGDKMLSGAGYYVSLEGRNAVYIVGTSLEDTILKPVTAMVDPILTSDMTTSDYYMAKSFAIMKGKEIQVAVERRSPDTASTLDLLLLEPRPEYGGAYAINSDTYLDALYALISLKGEETVAIAGTEGTLMEYGLINPAYTVYYSFNGNSTYVFFSQKQKDGSYYAMSTLTSGMIVCRVAGEKVEFLEKSDFNWIQANPFYENISDVAEIEIISYTDDINVDFVLKHGTDESGTATLEVREKNSDTLIKNEDVRNFRQYYLNLLNITNKDYTSLSEEDRESLMADESKKLMTLMIQKTDGTVTHYDFYRLYESSTAHISSGKVFVVVNGIGEFYTSNDLIDKIVNDTPRVLDGRDIDGYAQR